jgi:DNA-directed RNA polymerase subunit RPC12/RpoP
MPEMLALNCPNCKAPLEVPDNRQRYFCQFCGTPVLVLERASAAAPREQSTDESRRHAKGAVAIPEKLRIEELGDELTLSWSWFNWAVAFLIPFCIAWNGFLVGWYSMASHMGDAGMPGPMKIIFLVFPIGHVAVGLGLLYACLAMLFNRTTIRVGRGQLAVKHGPIYFPGGRTVPVDDIEQLYCTREFRAGSKGDNGPRHELSAKLKSGRSIKLLPGNMDADVIQAVEHLVEKHLGIEDRAVPGEAR